MKANLGGLGGIKHFFVAHGEKVGIVLVGLCALWMIYGALGRESLPPEKEAAKLTQVIAEARSNMEGFSWGSMKKDFPDDIREAKPLQTKGDGLVSADAYFGKHRNIGWDPSPVPPVVRRTDPALLEPQDVEANGGSGLLAFVDPAVRRQKILEEQRKAAELAKKQQKDQEKQNAESERGGRAARGGRNADAYGMS